MVNLEEASDEQRAAIDQELEEALADYSTLEQEIDKLSRPLPHERAAGDAAVLQSKMTEWITVVQKTVRNSIDKHVPPTDKPPTAFKRRSYIGL